MDPITHRPLVAVTGPDEGGELAWVFTRWALWRAGARVRRLTPSRSRLSLRPDALVIGGGADVDPRLYDDSGESLLPVRQRHRPGGFRRYAQGLVLYPLLYLLRHLFSVRKPSAVDRRRDELELRLLAHAVRHGIPVLGICRGAQLINIFFGGSLHRDLSGFYEETPRVRTFLPRKLVRLAPSSRLAAIIGQETLPVNALHDQAIDALGREIIVSATEDNGVIQAIEHPSRPFLIGVQWHPEYLPQLPAQAALFDALVRSARVRIRSRVHRLGDDTLQKVS